MASYAPLLAKKGFTQWKTDMIFFDNKNICPTPNYYVQKLFCTNQGNLYLGDVIRKDEKDSALAASCVMDSKTGDIVLKLVNAGIDIKTMKIDLTGLGKINPIAEQTVLSGEADAENTFDHPGTVVPVSGTLRVNKTFEFAAPAMSMTVIRIKPNN
jgi:alpha-L-arabinofuranosidase